MNDVIAFLVMTEGIGGGRVGGSYPRGFIVLSDSSNNFKPLLPRSSRALYYDLFQLYLSVRLAIVT